MLDFHSRRPSKARLYAAPRQPRFTGAISNFYDRRGGGVCSSTAGAGSGLREEYDYILIDQPRNRRGADNGGDLPRCSFPDSLVVCFHAETRQSVEGASSCRIATSVRDQRPRQCWSFR